MNEPKFLAEKIFSFLDKKRVSYRVITHETAVTAEDSSRVTQTRAEQGAKALIMIGDGKPLMVVIRGCDRANFKKIKKAGKIKDLKMATPEEVTEFSGAEIGAIPPFGNLFGLPLYFDNRSAEQTEIAFSAGIHTQSIIMSSNDFVSATCPIMGDYTKEE